MLIGVRRVRRPLGLITLGLVMALIMAGCSSLSHLPKIEDIGTVKFAHNSPARTDPDPLLPSNPHDAAVINKLLGWLAESRVEHQWVQEPIALGGDPTVIFNLKSGKTFWIHMSSLTKDEVLLESADDKPTRLKSPKLYEWLSTDGKQDLK